MRPVAYIAYTLLVTGALAIPNSGKGEEGAIVMGGPFDEHRDAPT